MAEAIGSKRGRLDRRMIVDAILELAREEPSGKVTFKRLGEALGVDATAMYRHFRNKEELTRAALDRLSEMAVVDAEAATGGWRERLEAHLMRIAELSLEYPSIAAEGAILDPVGPGDVAGDEFVLARLSEAGLTGPALIRVYAAVSGFSLAQSAAMAQEVVASRGAARDGSIPWISTFGSVDLAQYPLVNEHRAELLAIDGMAVYRAGIEAILDSVRLPGELRVRGGE